MAKELYVGIFEKDASGKKTEIDVADWEKLEDANWISAAQIFGSLPQQMVLMRPKAEMLSPEGMTIAIADKRNKRWSNITFDQWFVAECLKRDFLERLNLDPKAAEVKISGWLDWISQKDLRNIKLKVDEEIAKLQREYVKVYGSPLPKDEAIKTLKVAQPTLMRDFQAIA
ncbi:hypothetical protein PN499_26475 [Kamptonema animale CS-326]|jgi:hypothetical protein|uniref:hypothetical protein n=1 Tax=Kamptonema animale TaxID=92934 RepID=UPI00232DBFAD|nr:hypothetical protein [Kamptonema animale]MDB9514754.1 hypothetical protein [Kamptonema animale CS-326]